MIFRKNQVYVKHIIVLKIEKGDGGPGRGYRTLDELTYLSSVATKMYIPFGENVT